HREREPEAASAVGRIQGHEVAAAVRLHCPAGIELAVVARRAHERGAQIGRVGHEHAPLGPHARAAGEAVPQPQLLHPPPVAPHTLIPSGSLSASRNVTLSSAQSTTMRELNSAPRRAAPTYSSLSLKTRYARSMRTLRPPRRIVSSRTSMIKPRPPGFTVASSRPSSERR